METLALFLGMPMEPYLIPNGYQQCLGSPRVEAQCIGLGCTMRAIIVVPGQIPSRWEVSMMSAVQANWVAEHRIKERKQICIPSDAGYSLNVYRFASAPFIDKEQFE